MSKEERTIESRVAKTRTVLRVHNVDGLLLVNIEDGSGANIRYLSGFTGSTSICLLTQKANVLLTDWRYELQAKQEAVGCDVVVKRLSIEEVVAFLKTRVHGRVGLIGEETLLSMADILREEFLKEGSSGVEFVSFPNVVEEVRAVKDATEVENIRAAVRMMEEVLRELYLVVKPGVTTDCELATALKIKLIERGSDASFPPIILSGPDSAFVHGNPFTLKRQREFCGINPAEKVIQRGDIIQFDVGCWIDGYSSDISRVVVVGSATDEQKRMHRVICDAIDAAGKYYRPGIQGDRAQAEADSVLKKNGFGEGLVHGLGHGIGLEVHEFPSTAKGYTLGAGNVISLEPGVYREGYGGMRIERDVLITKNGPEFLDELTIDLLEI